MKKPSLNIIFAMLFVLKSFTQYAQNEHWTNYTAKEKVNCIAIEGEKIWLGTTGGVVLRDTNGLFITSYTTIDGLASNTVRSAVIDQQGNKWFGGNLGITKFNGINWDIYNSSNSSLLDNQILDITVDSQNHKWFATVGGVSEFDGTNWTSYTTSNSGLTDNFVRKVIVDSQNNKWFATNSGLVKYDGTNWLTYTTSNSGLCYPTIQSLCFDALGNLWIGTENGVSLFNGGNWACFNSGNSIVSGSIIDIAKDVNGDMWCVKYNNVNDSPIYKFDGINWTLVNVNPADVNPCIEVDSNGNKWFGGIKHLTKYDNNNSSNFSTANIGLVEDDVFDIDIDSLNNKWIAIQKFQGLATTNDEINWQTYASTWLGATNIVIDNLGNKWCSILTYSVGISTTFYNTLYKFNGSYWDFMWDPGLGIHNIPEIIVDHSGNIWACSTGGGVSKFDGISWTNYNTSNSGLPHNYVNDIAIDSLNNIWMATYSGLAVFDGNNWITYNTSNSGLIVNSLRAITIDKQGRKWLCTTGANEKIIVFDDTSWVVYDNNDFGFIITDCRNITIDQNDIKWFALNNGILKFDNTTWQHYTTSNSYIVSDDVNCIAIDTNNNKWIGTRGGISVLSDANSTNIHNEIEFSLQKNNVCPNPLKNISRLNFDNKSNLKLDIEIYDLNFQKIITIESNKDYILLDRNKFGPSGIYIYQICYPEGRRERGKILVE